MLIHILYSTGTESQSCISRYHDDYALAYWKNFCFPAEKVVTHVDSAYRQQSCRFYCDQVSSCMLYQTTAHERCILGVFNHSDIAAHQLTADVDFSTTDLPISMKTAHEVVSSSPNQYCYSASYGHVSSSDETNPFEHRFQPHMQGQSICHKTRVFALWYINIDETGKGNRAYILVSSVTFCGAQVASRTIAGFRYTLNNGTSVNSGCDDSGRLDHGTASLQPHEIITGLDLHMTDSAGLDQVIVAVTLHTNAAQYGPYGSSGTCMTSLRGYSLKQMNGYTGNYLTQLNIQFERCGDDLVVADTCTGRSSSGLEAV